MGYTDPARNAMLDHLSSLARWVSLHTGDPGETGTAEVVSVPYGRQQINWNAASLGRVGSDSKPLLRVPQGVQATHVGLWSSQSGGTFYGAADVTDVTYRTEAGYVLTSLSLDLTGFVLTAPEVPLNIQATATSTSTIEVTWDPVLTAESYGVERSDTGDESLDDFIFVATVQEVEFTDVSLLPAHTYYYRVQALNAAGGSRFSLISQATTESPPAEELPDTPTGLAASNVTSIFARITWNSANRAESYRLERSLQSTSGFVTIATVGEPLNDNEPPSVPQNLRLLSATTTVIRIAWDASTDNVGVSLYQINMDGVNLGVVGPGAESATQIPGLQPSTTYTFEVSARDTSNNRSAFSAPLVASTAAEPVTDTTPPSVPTNLTVSGVTQSSVTLTWTGSVDAVGVTGYEIEQNGAVVRAVSSTGNQGTVMAGLAASTSYSFRVRALDAAENASAFSSAASVTTSAPVTGSLFVALTGDMCENNFPSSSNPRHEEVSNLIVSESRIHAALLCGDLQYSSGTIAEFNAGYRNGRSYARHDSKNILTPGNHEANSGFQGYDDHLARFDTYVARGMAHQPGQSSQRWYGVHLPNGWSVVSLDSNVPSSSTQLTWLNNWLQNETVGRHVIAQWHHPRWNVRTTPPDGLPGMGQLYTVLYNNRVDILLVGHAHYFMRLPRMNPSGNVDNARGVYQLLVGTGGHSLDATGRSNPLVQAYINNQHGICELELTNTTFTGTFYNPARQVLDRLPVVPVLDRTL